MIAPVGKSSIPLGAGSLDDCLEYEISVVFTLT
jgi:hypothetical protein